MPKYVLLDKEVGETPLSAILSFKEKHPEYTDVPMTYAGRLDPMASGKLLILVGDECKRQKIYHALDKRYEFSILFGFTTDTGDVLGMSRSCSPTFLTQEGIEEKIFVALKELPKKLSLPYPVYSSKTVEGKPLFLWTLEDKIHEIDIPHFTSNIFNIRHIGTEQVSLMDLQEHIHTKIDTIPKVTEESKKLGADFRRVDIHDQWHKTCSNVQDDSFFIARFVCDVSSGMYIRSLAPYIAELCGSCGLAYRIHRSRIGHFVCTPFGGFWRKRY